MFNNFLTKVLISLAIIFLNIPCFNNYVYAQQQESIKEPAFYTYDQAKAWVRENFSSETTDTSRSSWIRGLEYFYADGKGFLIINMKGKEYIFRGVPKYLWEEFKEAPSLGKFYHARIKGRYYFNVGVY